MSGIPVLTAEGDCIAGRGKTPCCGCTSRAATSDGVRQAGGSAQQRRHDDPVHRSAGGAADSSRLPRRLRGVAGIRDGGLRGDQGPLRPRPERPGRHPLGIHLPPAAVPVPAPTLPPIDQIEQLCRQLAETPHTRRAQAVTWKVWEDQRCYDPACLQSIWCRIVLDGQTPRLSMNVRFRSNDAYKAAFMNIFALVELQSRIAGGLASFRAAKSRWAAIATWPTASTSTARTWPSSRDDSWGRSASGLSRSGRSATRTSAS